MRRRIALMTVGLVSGVITSGVIVLVLLYLVVKGMTAESLQPQRWQPITPTPTLPPTPTVAPMTPTPPPDGIYVGGQAQVVSAVGVRLRKTPGYRNKGTEDILTVVPPRSIVNVIGGPEEVDDLQWWQVQWQGFQGWMAEATPNGVQLLAPVSEGP